MRAIYKRTTRYMYKVLMLFLQVAFSPGILFLFSPSPFWGSRINGDCYTYISLVYARSVLNLVRNLYVSVEMSVRLLFFW